MTTMEGQEQLESIIDAVGLDATLGMLAGVCLDKAEHLRANWQDDVTANAWIDAARKIDKAKAGCHLG